MVKTRNQVERRLCELIALGKKPPFIREPIPLIAMENSPYYSAFGGYTIYFSGTYCRCGKSGKYTFRGEWEFFDEYDWHKGMVAMIGGVAIKDDWALLVENKGLAQHFTEKGIWRGELTVTCKKEVCEDVNSKPRRR